MDAAARPAWRLGVRDLLAAYGSGAATPQGVVAVLLDRAGARGPAPEATLCAIPGALALAEDSARRWRDGAARPLEGVPFGVKDIIDVAGARVTCGSLHTGDRYATQDAACVARLRAAGAIPLLMLATSEYACGAPDNARYGAVPNPWDRTRWAGGSSTGSGAALAARLVPFALGTDTGGSIRIPSAFCGVTGLKPTHDLVPRSGVATLSWTLDHVGPMARYCADLALLLPVLADPAPEASPQPGRVPCDGIDGLRVGVADGWFRARCDTAILSAFRSALEVLEQAGATLRAVSLPDPGHATEDGWTVLLAELADSQEPRLCRMELFDPGTRDRIARGLKVTAADYLGALRRRLLVKEAMLDAMAGLDVVVMPGVGCEAPRLTDAMVAVDGAWSPMYDVTPRNTMIFDVTGLPALMLPMGLGAAGLPVALQVVARPFQDTLCLAVGAAFQALTKHHLACPPGLDG